jgi:hypothetical protein
LLVVADSLAYQLTKHDLFISVVSALMMRNGKEAGRYMLENAGKTDIASKEQVDNYCQGIQDIADASVQEQFFEHLGVYIHDFFKLAFTHKVKLDHNFVCIALAIKVRVILLTLGISYIWGSNLDFRSWKEWLFRFIPL